jgi:hypothetical protein
MVRHGAVFRIERQGSDFLAQRIFGLTIFPCEGMGERDSLRMRFAGWSRPLEAYATPLEDAGLAITSLREPVPSDGDRWDRMQRWTRIPLFLWLKARPFELK